MFIRQQRFQLTFYLQQSTAEFCHLVRNDAMMPYYLVFAEVDLLQLLDMQSATHYNVSATEDDRGHPAYLIGQYATLSLPTAAVFGPL